LWGFIPRGLGFLGAAPASRRSGCGERLGGGDVAAIRGCRRKSEARVWSQAQEQTWECAPAQMRPTSPSHRSARAARVPCLYG
jgi:hypothetical protein